MADNKLAQIKPDNISNLLFIKIIILKNLNFYQKRADKIMSAFNMLLILC